MRIISLTLIALYQRFISPYKGFHCAHHQLNKGDTCSNAVKSLVHQHGLIKAWPKIQQRFTGCRQAYDILRSQSFSAHERSSGARTDLFCDFPCDLPCDASVADCGSGKSGSSRECVSPCDLLDLVPEKRRHRRIFFIILLVLILLLSYWFYGRGVHQVQLQEVSSARSGFLSQLFERDQPNLRVLIEVDGKTYHSNIATFENAADQGKSKILTLTFDVAPLSYQFDALKITDARVNIGNELLVAGRVIDEFEQPTSNGTGQRFSYALKRRWHF